jgi:hypothetical protein
MQGKQEKIKEWKAPDGSVWSIKTLTFRERVWLKGQYQTFALNNDLSALLLATIRVGLLSAKGEKLKGIKWESDPLMGFDGGSLLSEKTIKQIFDSCYPLESLEGDTILYGLSTEILRHNGLWEKFFQPEKTDGVRAWQSGKK